MLARSTNLVTHQLLKRTRSAISPCWDEIRCRRIGYLANLTKANGACLPSPLSGTIRGSAMGVGNRLTSALSVRLVRSRP